MVTIYDIAEKLKISPSTVSRALNDNSRISQETRNKVKKEAHKLGYIPNVKAQQLRLGITNIIGIIIPHSNLNDYYQLLINGILEKCNPKEFQVILLPTYYDKNIEIHYLNMLKSKALDSIILCSTALEYSEIEKYNHYGYIISCEKHDNDNIPYITTERLPAYIQALSKLNHKDEFGITFTRNVDSSFGSRDIFGYFYEKYLNFNENNIYPYCRTYEDGYKAGEYFSKNKKIRIIFANSDEIAMGVLHYYQKHYKYVDIPIVIGQDYSVLSRINNIPSINFQMEKIGHELYEACQNKKIIQKRLNSVLITN